MAGPIEGCIRTEEGNGVADVCVSNGREVVQSDIHGQYKLPRRPEDRFVFITVPSRYVAADSFYIDLKKADGFDFVLKHHPERERTSFAFVQITDMHISVERRAFAPHLEQHLA